uniref:SLC26A/SulP transporter domain-containing protein n=1 Tax=Anabas testudineus TaxID=64144 RepID=A0A7N6B3R0_ANATE
MRNNRVKCSLPPLSFYIILFSHQVLTMAERRRPGYSIYREILDEEAVDVIAQKSESKTSLCEKVKKSVRCSGPRAKRCLLETIPILSWLPRYPIRENALGDLISGISVGVMHLPQGMAYALLASVSPVFGLYSSFYPILVYFIFGTSKHISIGTYAVMSVMIGGVTERLAPDSDFMNWDNVTNSSIIDTVSRDAQRVKVAAAVTFMSGLFQILLGLVKFGFVVTYLSEPLVRGYTTAAAIHVIVSQLKYTFGINPKRHSGPFSLIYTILEVCYLVPQTNIGTLVVSIVTIICLILAKELNAYLQKKLPVPIPVELIAIIIATVVSWQVNLEQKYGVDIVGVIPSGLQAPVFPEASLFGQVIGDAFALSVVGYGILISLGRIFALKYGYRVDSNQELIALGLSNSIGGIFQCFAISCSMSRTMVQESTGGKTQVHMIGDTCVTAVLAAIIYVNLHGMMKQFMDIPALWKKNRVDMLVWVGTLILTILFNPDMGLAASIGFAMLTVIFRTQLPKYSLLGQVPDTDIYRPLEDYTQVKQVPGIFIFRSSATIYFANAEMYQDALGKKCGVDITKLLSAKKKLEAKRKRHEKEEAKKAKKAKKNADDMVRSQDSSLNLFFFFIEMLLYFLQTVQFHNPASMSASCPEWGARDGVFIFFFFSISCLLHSPLCLPTGFNTRLCLHIHYSAVSVSVSLSLAGVVDNLQSSGFFNDKVTKSCLFTTIHDAVLFCQSTRTDCQDKVTYCLSSQTCTSTHIVHHRAFCCESGRNLSC